MSPKTNLPELAQLIQQQCKLIHPSKLPELEQLLAFLQTRTVSAAAGDRDLRSKQASGSMLNHVPAGEKAGEKADISAVEQYMEGLYDEAPAQLRSTAMLLQLVCCCCLSFFFLTHTAILVGRP